jgi:hypothetical protein
VHSTTSAAPRTSAVLSIGRPRTKAEAAEFFGKTTRIEQFMADHMVPAAVPKPEKDKPPRNPKYAQRKFAA